MAAIKSASLGATYRREKAEGSVPQGTIWCLLSSCTPRHSHSIVLDPVLFQKHRHSLGREADLRLCADGAGPVEPDSVGAFLDIKIS